jgi:hypothetical protein
MTTSLAPRTKNATALRMLERGIAMVIAVGAATCGCGESDRAAADPHDTTTFAVEGIVEAIWGTDDDVFFAERRQDASAGTVAHLRSDGWMQMPAAAQWTVSGTSRSDVWMAGRDVLHYEGASWQHPVPLVAEDERGAARGLVAFANGGSREVWIAGDMLIADGKRATVWRVRLGSDAVTAAELEPIAVPLSGSIEGITGSGPSDIWIFGEAGLAHHDGERWSIPERAGGQVHAAWARARDDVWFVGERGRVERWNGTRISASVLPADSMPLVIGGVGENDVWVGGTNGLLAHWDGASWRTFDVGGREVRALFVRGDELWIGGPGFRLRTSVRALRPTSPTSTRSRT